MEGIDPFSEILYLLCIHPLINIVVPFRKAGFACALLSPDLFLKSILFHRDFNCDHIFPFLRIHLPLDLDFQPDVLYCAGSTGLVA